MAEPPSNGDREEGLQRAAALWWSPSEPAALWWSPSEKTSAQAQSGLPGLDVAPGLQTALEDSPSPACAHGRMVG